MRVLHLSASDAGGAGFAAGRLHGHLQEAGVESLFVSRHVRHPSRGVVRIRGSLIAAGVVEIGRVLTRYAYDADRFFTLGSTRAYGSICRALERVGFRPDVIVAHWTSRYVTPRDLRHLAERFGAPLILHLLDLEPFTGGCHYPLGCQGYVDRCGSCPALRPRGPHDLSHRRLAAKVEHYAQVPLGAVATCEYTYRVAAGSALLRGRPIEKILYGIDPDRFRPADPRAARRRLGLPTEGRLVFAAAVRPRNRRKGMKHLLAAARELAGRERAEPVTVAIAGESRGLRMPALGDGVRFVHLGRLDAMSLVDAYQAADLFACPSVEDAGPMMISEAMMCGTPIVSFDMGVARDLVHSGRTGYRASLADSHDFARGIETVLAQDGAAHDAMRRACRDLAISVLHPRVQVEAFIRFFEFMRRGAGAVGRGT